MFDRLQKKHRPFTLSLSKHNALRIARQRRSWFDGLTTNGLAFF